MDLANLNELHDRDFNLWINKTIDKIKNQDLENMDWENLIIEIEDMGASQKRALESYLQRLIEHILKLKYWKSELERNQNHWKAEVINFRNQIKRILKKNPSLKNHLKQEYSDIFNDAIASMSAELNIELDIFIPDEQIMDNNYFG